MSKDKQEVRVWEIIFYTEDENGGITYYEALDDFGSYLSVFTQGVELESLRKIEPEAVLAYEKVKYGVSEEFIQRYVTTKEDKSDRIQPTFSIGEDGEPMI